MSTLLICLAGPMQAWGVSSRFTNRETGREPSKSGVLGLLAAAQGIRRTDSIEHLLGLTFGVRVDREGLLRKDFQTARSMDGTQRMPLSNRYYLADAVFVAGVEGEADLIDSLGDSIKRPTFPLFLGRRSYPPSRPLFLDTTERSLREALHDVPWQLSAKHRRAQSKSVSLRTVVDGSPGSGHTVRDVPISFDPRRREYGWRTVIEFATLMDNPDGQATHDPMALLGGV